MVLLKILSRNHHVAAVGWDPSGVALYLSPGLQHLTTLGIFHQSSQIHSLSFHCLGSPEASLCGLSLASQPLDVQLDSANERLGEREEKMWGCVFIAVLLCWPAAGLWQPCCVSLPMTQGPCQATLSNQLCSLGSSHCSPPFSPSVRSRDGKGCPPKETTPSSVAFLKPTGTFENNPLIKLSMLSTQA